MILLGLVLAIGAIVIGASVVIDNSDSAELSAFGASIPGISSEWQIFLAGAVVAILFMTGLVIVVVGIGRSIRLRRELRDLRDEHEETMHTLEQEKRHLQRELARARRDGSTIARPVPQQAAARHTP